MKPALAYADEVVGELDAWIQKRRADGLPLDQGREGEQWLLQRIRKAVEDARVDVVLSHPSEEEAVQTLAGFLRGSSYGLLQQMGLLTEKELMDLNGCGAAIRATHRFLLKSPISKEGFELRTQCAKTQEKKGSTL